MLLYMTFHAKWNYIKSIFKFITNVMMVMFSLFFTNLAVLGRNSWQSSRLDCIADNRSCLKFQFAVWFSKPFQARSLLCFCVFNSFSIFCSSSFFCFFSFGTLTVFFITSLFYWMPFIGILFFPSYRIGFMTSFTLIMMTIFKSRTFVKIVKLFYGFASSTLFHVSAKLKTPKHWSRRFIENQPQCSGVKFDLKHCVTNAIEVKHFKLF